VASGRNLYDRLGGGPVMRAVVDRFYERVLLDPVLRPYFDSSDVGRIRRHQALFLSQVTGGPSEYDGPSLLRAHAGRGIDDRAFGLVARHLADTLRELGVGPTEIDEVMNQIGGLYDVVVQTSTGGKPSAGEGRSA
jgi:hemoglobin